MSLAPRAVAMLCLAGCTESFLSPRVVVPQAALTEPAPGTVLRQRTSVTLRGLASDAAGGTTTLSYAFQLDGVEACAGDLPAGVQDAACPIVVPAEATSLSVSFVVRAPDGTLALDTRRFDVVPTGAPTVTITAPDGAGRLYADRPITVLAVASDPEDGPTSLDARWTVSTGGDLSALDGPLDADGRTGGVVRLAEGTHTLAVEVTDPLGLTGSDAREVEVGPPNRTPTCAITAPEDGAVYELGQRVDLTAEVADPDQPPETLTVRWSSQRDGTLGADPPGVDGVATLSTAGLTAAAHVITLDVTDETGARCTAASTLRVGSAPVLTWTLPTAGSVHAASATVPFAASVVDPDQDRSTLQWTWTSDVDGVVSLRGAGSSGDVAFDLAGLTPGEHELTVRVTDAFGLYAEAARRVRINRPPQATAVDLLPQPMATSGVLVAAAAGTDADGDALSWRYAFEVDGVVVQDGPSTTLAGATWFDRDQAVVVTATASDGLDTASVRSAAVVIADTPPTAPGVAWLDSDVVAQEELTCVVDTPSTDADGDPITYRFAWTVDGVPYRGATDAATSSTVPGRDVHVDEDWRCTVTPDDGTLDGPSGSADLVIGPACVCLSFTDRQYAVIAERDVATLSGTSYTIEVWYQQTGPGGLLLANVPFNGLSGYRVSTGDTPGGWRPVLTIAGGNAASSANVDDVPTRDVWHHLAVVYDRGDDLLTIFVDGEAQDYGISANDPVRYPFDPELQATQSALHIGRVAADFVGMDANYYFNGLLGGLRISRYARFDGPFVPETRFGPDVTAEVVYDFGDGQGVTIADRSGSGHDAFIVGATWVRGCPAEAP